MTDMKTLILYATKHGATREIAQRIAGLLDGATLIDLEGGSVPALDGYDCVLIGSSVYAGMLRKAAKAFAAEHKDALMNKTLGLFVSGISPEGAQGYLDANYPKEVVAHAKAKAMLGGAFDPAKTNFFEKLVMRVVTKQAAYTSTISDEKIGQFAQEMEA